MNFILQLIILLTLSIASHAVEKFEPQLKLRQPFEDVLRGEKAIYGCSEGVTVSKIQNLMMNTPLSLGFGPALAAITNSVVEFSSEQAEKIEEGPEQRRRLAEHDADGSEYTRSGGA